MNEDKAIWPPVEPISAGLRGVQVLMDPRDLARLTNATTADLADA